MKFKLRFFPLISALLLALPSAIVAADAKPFSPETYVPATALKLGIPSIAIAVFFVWWQWDKFGKLPGILWLGRKVINFARIDQLPAPVPIAGPGRFSVMTARFEDDQNDGYAKLLVNALTGLEGIQVLVLEKPISTKSSRPRDAEQFGHESARALLRQAHAQMLIWGRIISVDGKSGIQILWTTLNEGSRSADPHQLEGLKLPQQFWEEFIGVIQLQIVAESTEFHAREGQFVADQLRPFIEKTERLLADTRLRGWSENARAQVRFRLAHAYQVYGEQAGDNASLQRAITYYNEVLKTWSREQTPLDWARIQVNLGNVLGIIGERESGTAKLEQAAKAYREALKERTRKRVPLDWATTHNNLGNVLQRLGEIEDSPARLEQAVEAYREALKERTRQHVPLDWAATQNNLGGALQLLGEREDSVALLGEAVEAYGEAFKERTRGRVPLDWGMTQNNLANALRALGLRQKNGEQLREALLCHSLAWEVFAPLAGHYASVAASGARRDLDGLKSNFPTAYQECLHQNLTILKQMNILTPGEAPG